MRNINYTKTLKTLMILLVMGMPVACTMVSKDPHSEADVVPITLLSSEFKAQSLEGVQTDRGLLFTFNNSVFFKVDKANLLPEGRLTIEKLVDTIQKYGSRKVYIEGHTDNTGEASYNQQLSEKRANTVRSTLVAKGVDPNRLVVKAYGETRPVSSNATKAGRQQNRRVEVLISNESFSSAQGYTSSCSRPPLMHEGCYVQK
jgi:outer membrane protein OmpA-like peptidoglycan-associated protein